MSDEYKNIEDALRMVGISGKIYVRAPHGFGKGKGYEFRVFESKEDYDSLKSDYNRCSFEEIMDDLETYKLSRFRIRVGQEAKEYMVDEYGCVIGSSDEILDIISEIEDEHGKDNVRFSHELKTMVKII